AGIAVLGKDDRVESANLAFAALAGLQRPDVVGKRLQDLLPIQPLPEPGSGLLETSFCDSTGLERHLQLSVAILERIGAGPQRVLVIQDVSDRVAMEHALREKDRMAALGMLAAGVAHEVNTPITGISSYAQMLLAETSASDPRYELLKKVERQTFRASRIVNSLLEFARKRQNEWRPVSLVALVDECAELLHERRQEKRVTLHWQRPDSDGARVLGDDGELQQVLTNIMLNAIEAMAKTGGNLRLTVETDENSGRARLLVEDDGPGIPKPMLEKIFQPFVTTKLGQGGTGLGLAISYQIVHNHGGELRVESEPGRTRFTIELPVLAT
ncbi:MAG TPA: ATP-binding protein, partial [Usitatibacter sp.]|nr:ATP-binding protein [Usitatibacter sp.]